MDITERLKAIYTQHSKKLLVAPLVLVIFAVAVLVNQVAKTGDVFIKDVSLQGGIVATISTDQPIDINQLESTLASMFKSVAVKRLAEFGSGRQIGVVVEVPESDENTLKQALEQFFSMPLTDENFSIEVTGSSVGSAFYTQMIRAMIFSFVFMAIVVFVFFRSFIPGVAAVLAALFDIIVTMAFVNILGVHISSAGVAAFLMLIGYSIDTDVLQTTRVLKKREATPVEGVISSIKTGLTMTVTSIVAVLLGYIFATSPVFKEMFLIITIGLFVDIIMTYFMNAPILLAYANKKMQPQNA